MASHGESQRTGPKGAKRLYSAWAGIKDRCLREAHPRFASYGGRGIRLHEPWVSDYAAFALWIRSNIGEPATGQSIDRIDNDGNYEPGNLRLATRIEQHRNKRSNTLITHPTTGETKCISEWAGVLGINKNTLGNRLARGVTIERALTGSRLSRWD